ncbi:MAG: AAA family ATPase [Candidatus Curtissbacteria bacterium]|nr:AAA family ATPase [Candidatus Curtissbacteria bacterium]
MKIRSLTISHFRGIQSLEWKPAKDLICLIGPGNSTKTTVLDAISMALTPHFSVNLTDADFFNCDVSQGIQIDVVLSNIPDELLSFDNLGGMICGVKDNGEVVPDPIQNTEKAIIVRFRADSSLEPVWEAYKPDSELPPLRLSSSMRASFGLFRLDERVDVHMRWSRGSALALLTSGTDATASVIAQARRAARAAVFGISDEGLRSTTQIVTEAARKFGATNYTELRPGIDPASLNNGYGLTLHDGEIPVTNEGLGVRRLTSLAIQDAGATNASIVLIDEIELGLEPHRLLHLINILRKKVDGNCQVILTSHSPLVVESLGTNIARVMSQGSTTTIKEIPEEVASLDSDAMQKMIRSGPSAMLATRVIVVEGTTEMGIMRAYCRDWDREREQNNRNPLAIIGTAIRNGQGDDVCLKRAESLAKLEYAVMAVLDSDKPLLAEEQAAISAGASVVRWGNGMAIEEKIASEIPEDKLSDLVTLAVQFNTTENPSESVLGAISAQMPGSPTLSSANPTDWTAPMADIREAIGKAAKRNKWFKVEDKGEKLGELLIESMADMQGTDLAKKMNLIRNFAYTEVDPQEAEGEDG